MKMGIHFAHFFGLQSVMLQECMNVFIVSRSFNGPFYRYSGHIEPIRFNKYYGMPRRHEHDPFFRLVIWSFTVYFSGKRLGISAFIQSLHCGVTRP